MDAPCRILLVEPDAYFVESLVGELARRFDAQITCTATATSCIDLALSHPHDLVIAEMNLPDARGTELAERLTALCARPIILTGRAPSCADAIAALRLGVCDLLEKPIDMERLLGTVGAVLRDGRVRQTQSARHRKLRTLVREVIRDRRDLSRRMDLICRDLVGAHRRLVTRVLSFEQRQS